MSRRHTELKCWDGKLFLAWIKDLHDQSIVGWSMGGRQTTDPVVSALVMARSPDDTSGASLSTPTSAT